MGLGLLKSSLGGGVKKEVYICKDLIYGGEPDGEKLLCLEKMCNLFLLIFNRWKERERNEPSRKNEGLRRGYSKMRVGLTLYSDNRLRLEALLVPYKGWAAHMS